MLHPPSEKHKARRDIADCIAQCAQSGNRSVVALTQAGETAASELHTSRLEWMPKVRPTDRKPTELEHIERAEKVMLGLAGLGSIVFL